MCEDTNTPPFSLMFRDSLRAISIALMGVTMARAYLVFLFLLSNLSNLSIASENPVFPNAVQLSRNERNAYSNLRVDCTQGDTINEISCNFTQVMLRKSLQPEDVEREFNNEWKKLGKDERDNMLTESARISMCGKGSIEQLQDVITSKSNELSGGELEELTTQVMPYMEYCKKPTIDSLQEMMMGIKRQKSKTCRLIVTPWKETFVYQELSEKWLSQQGPQGICGTIVLSSLFQSEDQKEIYEWTYQTRKVITNKEVSEELCGVWSEDPVTYKYSFDTKYVDCVFVDYGF